MTTSRNISSNYALTTNEEGSKALDIQQSILSDETYKQLIKAGLAPGMNVWEYGCGNGAMACELSHIVGYRGAVTAIDQSTEQLDRVSSLATERGLYNITARPENLDTFMPPVHQADFVFGRYILMHLQNPKNVLKNIYSRLLKPNGIALFGETCWDETYTEGKYLDEFVRFRQSVIQLGHKKGVDYNLGAKLTSAMAELNFKSVQEEKVNFLYSGKTFVDLWSIRLKELSSELVEKKCASKKEIEQWFSIADELAKNPGNIVMHAPMYYVSGTV